MRLSDTQCIKITITLFCSKARERKNVNEYESEQFFGVPVINPQMYTRLMNAPSAHFSDKPKKLKKKNYAAAIPLAVPGQGTAPPGESGKRAVKTSIPSSVTRRVCSN
jgi:hypothetical protein